MRKHRLVLATLAVVSLTGLEWPTRVTKPRPRCGVPEADYTGYQTRSRVVTGHGFSALAYEDRGLGVVPGLRERTIQVTKAFNLVEPVLAIEHCSISRVSVTVTENGQFFVSMRADQNPQFGRRPLELVGGQGVAGQGFVPVQPGFVLQTGHLMRNEFLVAIRFYANRAQPEQRTRVLGGAVLTAIDLPGFMVQRGEQKSYTHADTSPDLGRFFRQLDHIQVDFSYR